VGQTETFLAFGLGAMPPAWFSLYVFVLLLPSYVCPLAVYTCTCGLCIPSASPAMCPLLLDGQHTGLKEERPAIVSLPLPNCILLTLPSYSNALPYTLPVFYA
jgi:hypothetical protein